MTPSSPSVPTSRFVQLYWLYAIPIVLITVVVVGWLISISWNDRNFNGPTLANMLVVLAAPAVLSTVLSFLLQFFYFRRWASRELDTGAFSVPRFTLIFYGLNLLVSIILSMLAFPMFIIFFFFFAGLIPIFYLTPSHLLLGYLLARRLQREALHA